MFLQVNSKEINTHFILPNLQSPSDHALLMIDIIISEEYIQNKQWTIIKHSEKEEGFVNEVKNIVDNIDTTYILDSKMVEKIVQEFVTFLENLWNKYSKCVNITKHSKAW